MPTHHAAHDHAGTPADRPHAGRATRHGQTAATGGREAVAAALANPDVLATTLLVLVNDRFGAAAYQWSPEALAVSLGELSGRPVPDRAMDRLMAGIVVLTTDRFWNEAAVFNATACTMTGDSPGEVLDVADAAECAWAVTEALLIDPPEPGEDRTGAGDGETFSLEVRTFLAEVLKEEGILRPPAALAAAAVDVGYADTVDASFADDPTMFSAVAGAERAKAADVDDYVRHQLGRLAAQLLHLPLTTLDARKAALRVAETAGAGARAPIPEADNGPGGED